MNFDNYLSQSAQKIDEELDIILSAFLKEVKKTDIKLLPLALGFLNACKGGKRIRGMLVKLGYEIERSKIENEEIYTVGAAYEILHASLLIHDDIIDQSPLRRGKASLYNALGGNHYGISQAISLGDLGFFLAMREIAKSNFLEKVEAFSWLNEIMISTIMGEMLDVEKGDAITVMRLKTAKYSISGPLVLGAILAESSTNFLKILEKFGENLGIAYQIQDDILDGDIKTGTLDESRKKVLEYSFAAKKMILQITGNSGFRSLLEEMVEYLVRRTK